MSCQEKTVKIGEFCSAIPPLAEAIFPKMKRIDFCQGVYVEEVSLC